MIVNHISKRNRAREMTQQRELALPAQDLIAASRNHMEKGQVWWHVFVISVVQKQPRES